MIKCSVKSKLLTNPTTKLRANDKLKKKLLERNLMQNLMHIFLSLQGNAKQNI